ncbi:MAG: AtpZ/AtpI family protein [Chitinophagaceae bacterium]
MPSPNRDLMRYAGLATQFLIVIGISVFSGFKLDKWVNWRFPVWVWILPLLAIGAMIIGIIRDSSKK